MSTFNGFVIFTDIKGFSKIAAADRTKVYGTFYQKILPAIADIIRPYQEDPDPMQAFNTWGDGMMAAFGNGEQAVRFMIDYRDFFRQFNFKALNIPQLTTRIAGHFGHFHLYNDPIINQTNITGENVITSARIEPTTRPGEIYITQPFKDQAVTIHAIKTEFAFDNLGQFDLAKGFGQCELYRLRKQSEAPQVIDRILRQNLDEHLPQPLPMTDAEQNKLRTIKNATDREMLESMFRHDPLLSAPEQRSGAFLFHAAQVCKRCGLYAKALEYLNILDECTIMAHQIAINPYRYDIEVLKLKTDCLSRLRRYPEAANLIYGAWQMAPDDSNILSMLAAQYKRRALFGERQEISQEQIDRPMLNRAKNLYLEAFRRNLDEYYPAINAAYLCKMCRVLGNQDNGLGSRLAQYIIKAWNTQQDPGNWWLAISLAEAELVLHDAFEESAAKIANLVSTLNPPWFEKQSTREQIEIYGQVTGQLDAVQSVLKVLM